MDIIVKTTVTDEQLHDLLCSGIEGGINYWGALGEVNRPEGCTLQFASEVALVKGGSIEIYDHEADEEKKYILNREKLEKGLQIMADKYTRHFSDFRTDRGDAQTGDVLVQCAIFGEVIYG